MHKQFKMFWHFGAQIGQMVCDASFVLFVCSFEKENKKSRTEPNTFMSEAMKQRCQKTVYKEYTTGHYCMNMNMNSNHKCSVKGIKGITM